MPDDIERGFSRTPALRRLFSEDQMSKEPQAQSALRQLKRIVAWAQTNNLLDDQLKQGLKSNDWDDFWQALSELAAAYSLAKLFYCRVGRPLSGTYDWHCCFESGFELACEVKAPIGKPSRPQGGAGHGSDDKKLLQNLRKAAKQSGEDLDLPFLILLSPRIFEGDCRDRMFMHSILLGNHCWIAGGASGKCGRTNRNARVRLGLQVKTKAFWGPNSNTSVSAIACLRPTLLRRIQKNDFWIYHNPYSARPIPDHFFNGARQEIATRSSRESFHFVTRGRWPRL